MKGIKMFCDVEKALKAIESRFVGTTLNLQGSIRKFSEIEKMLKEERTQFEVSSFCFQFQIDCSRYILFDQSRCGGLSF